MFDITIVMQSFLYRPESDKIGRRISTRNILAEEEGLLSAGATGADAETAPPRRRTGVEGDAE